MKYRVNVKLRESGNVAPASLEDLLFQAGDIAILEVERGYDYGEIISEPHEAKEEDLKGIFKIIRKATKEDFLQIKRNERKARGAVRIFERRVKQHKLDMKLVDAEYSFDRSKIIFYFTSESRVDFRELVKNLASIFRVRIELRQIGVRDEARMLGGCGPCGRTLCCMSFLKDFNPVTIKMAKLQNLPLNPSKISGLCGRLMCCLGYEHECYKQNYKGMPKIGKEVKTEYGNGPVIAVNPLKRMVTVDLGDGKTKEVGVEEIK